MARGDYNRLSIEIAEERFSDLKKGQVWQGNAEKYFFICPQHGEYQQSYNAHQMGERCPTCRARRQKSVGTAAHENQIGVHAPKNLGIGPHFSWHVQGRYGKGAREWFPPRPNPDCHFCVEAKLV